MKKVIRILFILAIFIATACLLALFTGNGHLIKAVSNTYLKGRSGPSIDEYSIFENRVVKASKKPFIWPSSVNYNSKKLTTEELNLHEELKSVAFLVFHKDSIVHENYWNQFNDTSKTNTFSVAKSFIGLLIGAAIDEGYIKSVDQKLGDFLPEFKSGEKAKVTIKHLLQMNSGIDFGESYGDPFGFMAKAYYGDDLYDLTVHKEVTQAPGSVWMYQGGNTLLLSFIIRKATGKTVSEYFSEKIWQPIGAKESALWNLDAENGLEKAYCCFYSNARDFGKIGRLILNYGTINDQVILSQNYFEQAIQPVNSKTLNGDLVDYYGYQIWMTYYQQQKVIYARGIQGQYIVALPDEELIIVRLGRKRYEEKVNNVPLDLLHYIDMAKRLKN
ncbi:serine hydrolase domain-containing protein [Acidiluteibacter ferrifornacis]|uniref:Serine hydrolase n=1 Tax=Acidiluteibacter ferrifornacis TaxID=2692424 RepID=A0A6N9NK35_9FLAO|nr:serine hydrolase [Acidiluteibacter ferrifornacis]NBG65005.1 serine hydrolase [Acidiluteibacter ferrifornacis]